MSSSFWYHIYYESSLGQGIERTLVPGDWTCDSILFGDWGLYFDGYDIRRTDGKIAFIAGEGSMEGLCVANSDGSGVTRIREEGYEGVYIWDSPRWSPDGTKIAFHGYAESTVWLFVVNGTTGALESYFNFGGYYVKPYAWSPDGRYVLVGVYGSEFPDSVELWKVNPSSPETDYAYICGRANIWDADWGNLVPSGIENERNRSFGASRLPLTATVFMMSPLVTFAVGTTLPPPVHPAAVDAASVSAINTARRFFIGRSPCVATGVGTGPFRCRQSLYSPSVSTCAPVLGSASLFGPSLRDSRQAHCGQPLDCGHL